MKKTLLVTLFCISAFTTVSSAQMSMLEQFIPPSDSCEAIDKKIVSLDQFTQVVKNTSAFHLEEKASALPSPGFTVSNNKKQMLRDAKRKRAEYLAERQRYGCEAPLPQSTAEVADQTPVASKTAVSSDSCDAIDKKIVSLDQFTQMVKNTSAFHLEEKASALPSPGFTVSNNKKQMLRDAKRKRAEYLAERQRYGCEAPLPQSTAEVADQTPVASKTAVSSLPQAVREKETIKPDTSITKVATPSRSQVAEKAVALPVPQKSLNNTQTNAVKVKEVSQEAEKYTSEAPVSQSTPKSTSSIPATENTSYSSEECADINKELLELDQFTTMVNNTSAFHLEEKMSALPSPGFTVSTNKKKMLRDAEKKRNKLLAEHRKAGCKPIRIK